MGESTQHNTIKHVLYKVCTYLRFDLGVLFVVVAAPHYRKQFLPHHFHRH